MTIGAMTMAEEEGEGEGQGGGEGERSEGSEGGGEDAGRRRIGSRCTCENDTYIRFDLQKMRGRRSCAPATLRWQRRLSVGREKVVQFGTEICNK